MNLGIFCAGSLGIEILSVLSQEEKRYEDIYFIDDVTDKKQIEGKTVYKFEEMKNLFTNKEIEIVIATGEPLHRERLYEKVKASGYSFATIISKYAFVSSNATIEPGVVIFPHVYIGPNCLLHHNTIIHANTNIVGVAKIGCNSFLSIGVFVGDSTYIDTNTFIGPNASISDHIHIGKFSIIGIGTVVLKDIEADTVNVGVPAKMIRKNVQRIVFSN